MAIGNNTVVGARLELVHANGRTVLYDVDVHDLAIERDHMRRQDRVHITGVVDLDRIGPSFSTATPSSSMGTVPVPTPSPAPIQTKDRNRVVRKK